jgi:ubiquitin-protein ligase
MCLHVQWVIIMQGPDGQDSLYQDLVFRVKIRMGERYPLESPEVS